MIDQSQIADIPLLGWHQIKADPVSYVYDLRADLAKLDSVDGDGHIIWA
jgi:hypothetical protein